MAFLHFIDIRYWQLFFTLYWTAVLLHVRLQIFSAHTLELLGLGSTVVLLSLRDIGAVLLQREIVVSSPFGAYLLKTSYLGDAVDRMVVMHLVGLIAAIIILGIGMLIARQTEERVLAYRDARFLALGALMAGWPNVLIFLAFAFVSAAVVLTVLLAAKRKARTDRMRILPFVALGAILTLWLGPWIAAVTGLDAIRF